MVFEVLVFSCAMLQTLGSGSLSITRDASQEISLEKLDQYNLFVPIFY